MTDTVYLVSYADKDTVAFTTRAIAEAYAKHLTSGLAPAKRWEGDAGEVNYICRLGSRPTAHVREAAVRTTEFWLKEPSDG